MMSKNWRLSKKRKYQYMAKDRDGRDVFLADSNYVLQMAQMDLSILSFILLVSLKRTNEKKERCCFQLDFFLF